MSAALHHITEINELYDGLSKKARLSLVQALTDPIIVWPRDDARCLPDWMPEEITRQRLQRFLNSREDSLATDVEAVAYMMLGTFRGLPSPQWCKIYLHSCSRLNEHLKEAMLSNGVPVESLTDLDDRELIRLKKWIRKQQKKGRSKRKINACLRSLNKAVHEARNFDLLCIEGQL